MKIIGLFSYYVYKAKSWNAVSVLNVTIMLSNTSFLSSAGFLRDRSCVTQPLSVLNTTGHNLDKNIQTDVVYLDFAKAFDSVGYSVLLQKLKRYDVEGDTLAWFTDYLS